LLSERLTGVSKTPDGSEFYSTADKGDERDLDFSRIY
jgi:hypothetical protein